jgi:predicted metal-dependent hydrolase
MKLSTRDLLVELLLEAFDEIAPADVVRARAATLTGQFPSEEKEVTDKLDRYIVALEEWHAESQYSAPQYTARDIALSKAALLFNHHLFFEMHEVLEAQWRVEHDPARLFLQGLIQIAVAFHHLERRNFRGAVSLLHDGLEKIMPARPAFLGVELQEFVAQLIACHAELQRLGPEHCDQFQSTRIPRLQFHVD